MPLEFWNGLVYDLMINAYLFLSLYRNRNPRFCKLCFFSGPGSVIEYRDAQNVKKQYRRFNLHSKDTVFAQVLVARAQAQINSKMINYFDYFGKYADG